MTKKDIQTLHEIHPWHERYIKLTADLPPLEALQVHRFPFNAEHLEALGDLTYAPGKWTIREMLQHIVDTERILGYRALCLARGEQAPLPNYDEAAYGNFINTTDRTVDDLLAEFDLLRQATLLLFQQFDEAALKRTGIAAEKRVSVLAIAYILAGHPLHHLNIIQERYLPLIS